ARSVMMTARAVELAASLNQTGQASGARMTELLDHLNSAATSVEAMAERADKMLQLSPLPQQLALAGENIRQATEDVATLTRQARETAENEDVTGKMAEAIDNLTAASENVRVATENMARLTGDEDVSANIRQTLENVREASDSLRKAAEAAESLIADEQTTADLRTTISNFRQVSESSVTAIQRASDIMDDVQRTMESVRSTQAMISNIEAHPVIQMQAAADAGLRADAYIDLQLSPNSDDRYRIGVRDVGDSDRFDLLWSHPINRNMLRLGLIDSELGLAYEYSLGGNSAIEAEVYDPDDVRLNLGMRWGIWKNYDLLLGADRVGGGTDPYIGLRYR
ncbi:MAG: hypothetical protein J7M38_00765, partial [Armatimonadetes bacterium]|nr:hypothetical protein [Armatimonadota bacterium]